MASLKRWTLRIFGVLVVLVFVAASTIYALSSQAISHKYAFREVPVTLPSDSASLAFGAHFVELSCRGCHYPNLRGGIMFEEPGVARVIAPNVLEKIRSYSDAELAGYMRYGVRKDGSGTFVMPPPGFYHLSDDDLGSIIAYLRTLRDTNTTASAPALTNSYGPIGRLGIVTKQFGLSVTFIDTTVARVGADSSYRSSRHGEYLARVICTECHTDALIGDPARPSPSIAGAAGYSLDQFTTLMRSGIPRDPATTAHVDGGSRQVEPAPPVGHRNRCNTQLPGVIADYRRSASQIGCTLCSSIGGFT